MWKRSLGIVPLSRMLQKEFSDILGIMKLYYAKRVGNSVVLPRSLDNQSNTSLSISPYGRRKVYGRALREGRYVLIVRHSDRFISDVSLARKKLLVSIKVESGGLGRDLASSLGVNFSDEFGPFMYLGGGSSGEIYTSAATRIFLERQQRWVEFTFHNRCDRYLNLDLVSLHPEVWSKGYLVKMIFRWLESNPNALSARFILYADIDINVVDGSSVWLSSIASVLCGLGPTIVVLKRPILNDLIVSNISANENLFFLKPEDVGVSGDAISVDSAVEVIEVLDGMLPGVRGIFIRGLYASSEIHRTRQFYKRSFVYLTDFYRVNGREREISAAQEKSVSLVARQSGVLLTQTPEIKRFLQETAKTSFENIDFPPPVPEVQLERQPRYAKNLTLLIGYAGKIMPNWGLDELLDWVGRLRESGITVELHCVANKISDGGQQGFSAGIRSRLEAAGAHLYRNLNRESSMRMMSRMHLVWCWRPADFENSTIEVSTKLVEMVAAGARCVCFPGPVNRRVLGDDYPFFARDYAEFEDVVVHRLDCPVPVEIAARLREEHSLHTAMGRLASRLGTNSTGQRVCVVGHDMKFVDAFFSHVKASGHSVILDYWEWGRPVSIEVSRRNLEWADTIFCEWGLANAVWYSQNNTAKKPLFIRVHLQEVNERASKFGSQIDINNVSKMIFVSESVRRMAIEMFGWPEGKTVHIPNYVLSDEYRMRRPRDASEIHLGMVGIVPKRKRFDRAIDLLSRLRSEGQEAFLHIKGPRPETIEFMHGASRRHELSYYEDIYDRIDTDPKLRDRVEYAPWGNDVADWYSNIDYILSPSDFESFHYALADGVLSGCFPVVWPWDGAGELYSPDWIVENVDEAIRRILDFRGLSLLERERVLAANRHLVVDRYGHEKVFKAIMTEIGLS